jgi:hypothetical protein
MCIILGVVARDKTVTDVLAALTDEELARMRAGNGRDLARARAEVMKLEIEEQQLEAATAKRARGKPGRPGALTPAVVLDAVIRTEQPASASAVTETLVADGLNVTVNAVRNHLNLLVKDGELEKDGAKKYAVTQPMFVPDTFQPAADFPAAADDDIPF